jgi:cold shock CspA family protein
MYANVERYYPDRGFGFAVMLNEETVFFHIAGFLQPPEAVEYGDLLQFDMIPTPKGLRAVKIALAETEEEAHAG